MGEAVAAPAFDALAFAFAALAFALIAYTLIINPLRNGADAASGLPVIGGALAWALSNIANLIESSVYWVNSQKSAAYSQATAWWNWIVTSTIGAYYGDINGDFAWVTARISELWSQTFIWIPLAVSGVNSAINSLSITVNGLWWWQQSMVTQTIPDVYARLSNLDMQTHSLGNAVTAIESQTLPTINAWLEQLRYADSIAARWQANADSVILPRIRADVSARALESEAEALRQQLQQALRNIGILLPLAIVAVAGAAAIENLRCQMDVPCDPLSALAQGDVIDRLNNLEIGEG